MPAVREAYSAIYSGYRPFFLFCKLTGCCSIQGLWTKTLFDELKVKMTIWSALYSFLLLTCYVWTLVLFVEILVKQHFQHPSSPISTVKGLFYGYYVLLYLQSTVNAFTLVRHAGALLAIIRDCSSLETQIGLEKDRVRRRLIIVSRGCLGFMVLDCIKSLTLAYRVVPAAWLHLSWMHDWVKIVCVAFFLIGVMLVGLWFSMSFWMIVYNAYVLRHYFARVNELLVEGLSMGGDCGRALQRVRWYQAEIRDIVSRFNSVLGLQSTFYYGGSVYFMCATVFGAFLSNISVLVRIVRSVFVITMAIGLLVSARAGQKMTSERHLKKGEVPRCLFAFLRVKKVTWFLHLLLVTSEAGEKAFTGCGLFKVNLSMLVAISGAVITYTVVLVQTDEEAVRQCV
ncbi:hypothetical protein IscW_ISCW012700 [Ixodes scapularis]|uniref:Uncharacterized protein n=1 Tax=Ixodes scapularis TaxID=6945 RepID=B7QAI0_IXOSC|nr:hypothetical protein IscW_ISCW012700 [Ixodes scapularis]|eukprot:XP_002412556.1 hypothetical protein IscW_ISCW012700 [Ixodes scapularis]